MAAKKTGAKKTTTSKTTARRAATATEEKTPIGEKSCAYPSCSARATQQFGDNNVPSCDHHAQIFETQANDGAGIEQLVTSYKG